MLEGVLASRRGFMFGAGALLIAKPKLLQARLPLLWGDGIHDDTAALQALFSGQPVRMAVSGDTFAPRFDDGSLILKGGAFLISAPISIGSRVTLVGGLIRPSPSFKGDHLVKFDGTDITVMYTVFEHQQRGPRTFHPPSAILMRTDAAALGAEAS